jgi:hypothetical protein
MYVPQLTDFYSHILDDARINAYHISLFMALFQCWNENGFENPIYITRDKVMPPAKISGNSTYHRCMKDLHDFGYIEYHPSFHPGIRSRVYFKDCKTYKLIEVL